MKTLEGINTSKSEIVNHPPPPFFSYSVYREGENTILLSRTTWWEGIQDYEMVTLFMGQKATLKMEAADFSKMLVTMVS